MRISIIDDDYTAIRELHEELVELGHKVGIHDAYREPTEIAEAVKAFGPDVVLLDHFLTNEHTGADVARHLSLPVLIFGIGSVGNPGGYCSLEVHSKESEDVIERLDLL